jgi:hypothetical protein
MDGLITPMPSGKGKRGEFDSHCGDAFEGNLEKRAKLQMVKRIGRYFLVERH